MANKNIILTLDTETADLSGNVYDVGYIIHDKDGNIFATFNALERKFHKEKNLS